MKIQSRFLLVGISLLILAWSLTAFVPVTMPDSAAIELGLSDGSRVELHPGDRFRLQKGLSVGSAKLIMVVSESQATVSLPFRDISIHSAPRRVRGAGVGWLVVHRIDGSEAIPLGTSSDKTKGLDLTFGPARNQFVVSGERVSIDLTSVVPYDWSHPAILRVEGWTSYPPNLFPVELQMNRANHNGSTIIIDGAEGL